MVTCPDEATTRKVAQSLAAHLESGSLVELIGDVGSGKTTFVKGLAKGLSSKDEVSSPSFALKNVYDGRLRLYHFDLYRLEEAGLISHEISDALNEKDSAVVIEWADTSSDILPENRIKIEFLPDTENSRKLKITYPDQKEKR